MLLRAALEQALAVKQAAFAQASRAGLLQSTTTDVVLFHHPQRVIMAYKHSAEEYAAAAEEITQSAARMEAALAGLLAKERETSEKAKAACGRAKDSAAQVAAAMTRVEKILGSDFEVRLAQLERTASALERLAELQAAGRLQGVLAAIEGRHA